MYLNPQLWEIFRGKTMAFCYAGVLLSNASEPGG